MAVAASIIFGFLWSSAAVARHSAAGLHVAIGTPGQRVYAGERLAVPLDLSNTNRFLPVFYPCFSLQLAGRPRPQTFHYPAFIGPRRSVSITAHPIVAQRGRQRITLLGWTMHFPFSLHETFADCRVQSADFIVWPAKARLNARVLLSALREQREQRQLGPTSRADRSDPSTFREYRQGDSRRAINWKLTAKLGRLMVAESQPAAPRRLTLALELSESIWTSRPRFERMLSLVTATVVSLQRQGRLEALYLDGVRLGLSKRSDISPILDALALCEAHPPRPINPDERLPRETLRIAPSAEHGIALTASAEAPAARRQLATALKNRP